MEVNFIPVKEQRNMLDIPLLSHARQSLRLKPEKPFTRQTSLQKAITLHYGP